MSQAKTLRCPYCGKPKRRGGAADAVEYVCRTCARTIRSSSQTLRAWDRATDDRVAWCLIENAGRWVRLTMELGISSDDAAASVALLERRGFVVEGDPHRGRRLVSWTRWKA